MIAEAAELQIFKLGANASFAFFFFFFYVDEP